MTEQSLLSARKLIQAVGHAVPISRKDYVVLIGDLASDLQAVRKRAEGTTADLAEREGKLSELAVKVKLLTEEDERAFELQKRPGDKIKEVELVKRNLEAKKSVLKERSRDKGAMDMGLKSAWSAVGRGKRVIYDFDVLVCTACTILMRAQNSRYCERLNTVLDDAQSREAYLGGFHMRRGGLELVTS